MWWEDISFQLLHVIHTNHIWITSWQDSWRNNTKLVCMRSVSVGVIWLYFTTELCGSWWWMISYAGTVLAERHQCRVFNKAVDNTYLHKFILKICQWVNGKMLTESMYLEPTCGIKRLGWWNPGFESCYFIKNQNNYQGDIQSLSFNHVSMMTIDFLPFQKLNLRLIVSDDKKMGSWNIIFSCAWFEDK